MQRKPLLDMVPRKPQKKTIQRIEKARPEPEVRRERTPERKTGASIPPRSAKQRKKSPVFYWLFGIAAIFLAGFAALTYFASAEIVVTAKSDTLSFSAEVASSTPNGGDLPYRIMTIEKDATTTVPAKSAETLESKAEGTVIIYNNYSSAPYRLIKNTRLESADHLIFKLSDTVIVPGKKSADGTSVPGSVSAGIFAESPGENYNIGLADFTLPGFKGYPQYGGFYARSKTPVSGGFSGTRRVAAQADIDKSLADIRTRMSSDLLAEAKSEIPEGYTMIDGTYGTEITQTGQMDSGKGDLDLGIHATFRSALFATKDVEDFVIRKSGQKNPIPSTANGIDTLKASPENDIIATLSSSSPLSFTLSGSPTLSAIIDSEKLRSALAGSPRNSLTQILSAFPGISKASVSITPFWSASFPSDVSRIKVVIR